MNALSHVIPILPHAWARAQRIVVRKDGDEPQLVISSHTPGWALAEAARQTGIAGWHEVEDKQMDTLLAATYAEALALWRGEPYAGESAPYAMAERLRLCELQLTATEEHLAAEIALGRARECVPRLEMLFLAIGLGGERHLGRLVHLAVLDALYVAIALRHPSGAASLGQCAARSAGRPARRPAQRRDSRRRPRRNRAPAGRAGAPAHRPVPVPRASRPGRAHGCRAHHM